MNTITKLLLVMAGGSLGALCRYGLSLAAAKFIGVRFPWGTLAANLTGCYLIGGAFALSELTDILSPSARLFFMTGFLGALTTFSTYALETAGFVRAGSQAAAVNFVLNNVGGGLLVFAGILTVRMILKGG